MPLRVIPVIDLKSGQVVHARQGRRDSYRPILSPLCASSDLFQVINAFLSFYPFDTFYIADLDALMANGNHADLLEAAMYAYPFVEFWIDQGFSAELKLGGMPANACPVLGSESLSDAQLPELCVLRSQCILSLDFFGEQQSGPQMLFEDSRYWPERVIVMTLGRVGGAQGPDFNRLETYNQGYPNTKFIAAGGVRDRRDLWRLQQLGIENVLVASALHAQAVTAEDLRLLSGN